MSLKDITLENSYNSDDLNVVQSFFEPVLKESVSYKRVAAYFSSSSFKVLSEGLSAFVWNEGRMFLVVARLVDEEDYNSILLGKSSPEEVISSIFIKEKEDLRTLARDENFKALAYLLAVNKIEMKFVITSNKQSIFHLKFGIFIDRSGNEISFSGSINETLSAYSANIEEFKVFRSWIPEEYKYLLTDEDRFDSLFSGRIRKSGFTVVDLPDSVRNIILEIGDAENIDKTGKSGKSIILRDYQQHAFDSWADESYKGIIQMATGTGKTIVAISCIRQVIKLIGNSPVLILVGVPTIGLVDQWKNVLSEYFERDRILTTGVGKQSLYSKLSIFGENGEGYLVLIGTFSSLCKNWFTREIVDFQKYEILFVGDEAHWLGAPEFSRAMLKDYNYRLGLTATPIRHFDEEGTSRIMKYFGSVVFKFSIKEAIDRGYLTPYEYHIYSSDLTRDELREYVRLTRNITRTANYNDDEKEELENKLAIILSKRARIIKKANDKFRTVEEILDLLQRNNELKDLIIYLEDTEQIENFMSTVYPNFRDKIFRVIDSRTSKSIRATLIQKFAEGNINCIVCMKVLDEGLDIPTAERAIFVSSSTNPKQFIQRRGRILRLNPGKRSAKIYDIFVGIDPNEIYNENLKKIDRKITGAELTRICTFGANSSNRSEFLEDLDKIGKKTKINVWEILRNVEDDQ